MVRQRTGIWSWMNVSLLLPDYFLQLLINRRNPHYPFLIICSLSKLITRTCWLALWALHHVWYVVALRWLNSFHSNYLIKNCRWHQILLSRTFGLQCLASLRNVMLSMTSKSAAVTKNQKQTKNPNPLKNPKQTKKQNQGLLSLMSQWNKYSFLNQLPSEITVNTVLTNTV